MHELGSRPATSGTRHHDAQIRRATPRDPPGGPAEVGLPDRLLQDRRSSIAQLRAPGADRFSAQHRTAPVAIDESASTTPSPCTPSTTRRRARREAIDDRREGCPRRLDAPPDAIRSSGSASHVCADSSAWRATALQRRHQSPASRGSAARGSAAHASTERDRVSDAAPDSTATVGPRCFEPVQRALRRFSAGEHASRPCASQAAVAVQSISMRGDCERRHVSRASRPSGSAPPGSTGGPFDDLRQTPIVEEQRRRRRTVMRQRDEDAAPIDQAIARKVLTRRRHRRVADRRLDGATAARDETRTGRHGQRQDAGDIRRRVVDLAQPACGHRQRRRRLTALAIAGTRGRSIGDVPSRGTAHAAVAARIRRMKGQPECRHGTHIPSSRTTIVRATESRVRAICGGLRFGLDLHGRSRSCKESLHAWPDDERAAAHLESDRVRGALPRHTSRSSHAPSRARIARTTWGEIAQSRAQARQRAHGARHPAAATASPPSPGTRTATSRSTSRCPRWARCSTRSIRGCRSSSSATSSITRKTRRCSSTRRSPSSRSFSPAGRSTIRHYVAMTDAAHMPADTGITGLLDYESVDRRRARCLRLAAARREHRIVSVLHLGHRRDIRRACSTRTGRRCFIPTPSACPTRSTSPRATRCLPVVPMFHVNAWGVPYAAAMVGAKLVLPGPSLDRRKPARADRSRAGDVPARRADGVDGAARTPSRAGQDVDDSQEGRVRRLGGAAEHDSRRSSESTARSVIHAWGMTEMSPLGTASVLLPKHAALDERSLLALKCKQGRPIFGVDLRIVDDDGDGAAARRQDVRPSAGARTLDRRHLLQARDGPAHKDGWFDTGDIATIDEDGYVQITDRAKDVIKSGGEWISSIDARERGDEPPVGRARRRDRRAASEVAGTSAAASSSKRRARM